MKKDYSNTVIINNSGNQVKITNIINTNAKNEYVYGYICSICGKESCGTIDKIKRNKGCKHCKGQQASVAERLPLELVKQRIKENNPNVVLIGNYTGKSKDCLFKCEKHNIEFYKKPSSFLYNETKICPECIKESRKAWNKKYSVDDVSNIIKERNYNWLNKNEYYDASSILKIECKKCGQISKTNITSLKNGKSCKKCSGYSKKTTEEYKKCVFDLVGNEYEVLGEYIDNKTPITTKHCTCGHTWDVLPTNFLYLDRRCPKCRESKGEKNISNYLLDNNILFYREYSFPDCSYKKKLRFDFYLPDYNKCIEFQGKQHYIAVDYMGGQQDFIYRQIRDKIKKDYCSSHDIELIEIPYNQIQNINNILNAKLNKAA